MSNHNQSSLAVTALVFGAAGFVAGMLFAPKSGRETRHDLSEKAQDLKGRATSVGRSMKENLSETAQELRDTAGKTLDRTKKVARDAAQETENSLGRAKSKAEDTLHNQ